VTMLEFYGAAVFAAVWLVPALLAARWERRLRAPGKVSEASRR
jgi:hypothetical protein